MCVAGAIAGPVRGGVPVRREGVGGVRRVGPSATEMPGIHQVSGRPGRGHSADEPPVVNTPGGLDHRRMYEKPRLSKPLINSGLTFSTKALA
jgi:hypothetical protein